MTQQQTNDPEYLDWIWITKKKEEIKVRDMTRSHVQNTVNWCIRHQTPPDPLIEEAMSKMGKWVDLASYRPGYKDGHSYQEWIAVLTARLFDPSCK